MAIIDKTISELLKSIGIKLKPGLATNVERLENVKNSFNLDFSKFGKNADPKKMKELIETDADFVFRADEGEKQQFVNNVSYLKSEFPELFSKPQTITSAKTGEKLIADVKNPLGELTETEASLGVTSPEHRKLVKEYLNAKKEHLEAVEEANRKFNEMYKHGEHPMRFESEFALKNELEAKGLKRKQIEDILDKVKDEEYISGGLFGDPKVVRHSPEDFFKKIQEELKKTHGIDHDMDFYINFANQIKKPEFASGGRVGYDAGGAAAKAAIKALEKAKKLRAQAKQALNEGDWMSASTYDKQAQKIEAGYFLNKDPKDVTFPDILDYNKATFPDTPSRYKGIEGEHWVDRARNYYKQLKERLAKEGEQVEQLKIQAKPTDRDYDFAMGGSVLTPKSVASMFGKTVEKGIGSMFKKKKK